MAPWQKKLLSLFIVFHLASIVIWVLPGDSEFRRVTAPQVEWYTMGVGTWQAWDMFSPDPSNLNMYVHARVFNSDGTTWDYVMPRMDKLDYITRYEKERFRKYLENVHLDSNSMFWPDLGHWILNQEPKNKTPVRLQLFRTWWNVPPAGPDTSIAPTAQWSEYMFYNVPVKNREPQ